MNSGTALLLSPLTRLALLPQRYRTPVTRVGALVEYRSRQKKLGAVLCYRRGALTDPVTRLYTWEDRS